MYESNILLFVFFSFFIICFSMVQTMYKLCVCVFYLTCVNATRLLFLLPKIITPFQGNSYRLIITVTVALQQLDFASYLCLRVCVCVRVWVINRRRRIRPRCVVFSFLVNTFHLIFFLISSLSANLEFHITETTR